MFRQSFFTVRPSTLWKTLQPRVSRQVILHNRVPRRLITTVNATLLGSTFLGRSIPTPTQSSIRCNLLPRRQYKVATYEDVKKLTQENGEGAIIFDVRNPDEYACGAIPTSNLIPLPQVPLALSLSEEDFLDAYGIEKPARDTKIVFYCRSGARSASACEIARQAGYTNIHNYEGSYLDWSARDK